MSPDRPNDSDGPRRPAPVTPPAVAPRPPAGERLIAAPAAPGAPKRQGSGTPRWLWPVAVGVVAAIALAALFVWRTQPSQPATGIDDIQLSFPAGGPERADGPWVRLQAAPLRVGANRVEIAWLPAKAAAPSAAGVRRVSLALTPLAPAGEPLTVEATARGDGTFVAEGVSLPAAGWWRIAPTLETDALGAVAVPFDLVVPDPNINGTAAAPHPASQPDAKALYERGLAAMTGLHRVRFWQTMANGLGVNALSEHAVRADSGGATPAFAYHAYGGLEAVVIGDTMWRRSPGTPWATAEAAPMVQPSAWGEEYAGATGFVLGGEAMLGGERCRLVAFQTPDLTEPRTQVAAWYLWWVGETSGEVHREAMISRAHYMTNDFSGFDAPLTITPPAA
ncbi:MAG TPA: hypothetical protein VFI22_14525 [Thermomicrobiales bacterium]|nr:hypothetical protein [Thermomicrobiales bacterium]